MAIHYRPARIDDIQAVSDVYWQSVLDVYRAHGFGYKRQVNPLNPYYTFALQEEPDGFFVAEDGRNVVGATISWVRAHLWFLSHLFLPQPVRRDFFQPPCRATGRALASFIKGPGTESAQPRPNFPVHRRAAGEPRQSGRSSTAPIGRDPAGFRRRPSRRRREGSRASATDPQPVSHDPGSNRILAGSRR
jgi:hypothetical protein